MIIEIESPSPQKMQAIFSQQFTWRLVVPGFSIISLQDSRDPKDYFQTAYFYEQLPVTYSAIRTQRLKMRIKCSVLKRPIEKNSYRTGITKIRASDHHCNSVFSFHL